MEKYNLTNQLFDLVEKCQASHKENEKLFYDEVKHMMLYTSSDANLIRQIAVNYKIIDENTPLDYEENKMEIKLQKVYSRIIVSILILCVFFGLLGYIGGWNGLYKVSIGLAGMFVLFGFAMPLCPDISLSIKSIHSPIIAQVSEQDNEWEKYLPEVEEALNPYKALRRLP